MYLRLLAELIDILSTAAIDDEYREDEPHADHSEDAAHSEAETDAEEVGEVEHFFRLTRPHYADGVIAEGKVVSFCDEMVVRYLEKVVVEDDEYVVKLRVGWRLQFDLQLLYELSSIEFAEEFMLPGSFFIFGVKRKNHWKCKKRYDTISIQILRNAGLVWRRRIWTNNPLNTERRWLLQSSSRSFFLPT